MWQQKQDSSDQALLYHHFTLPSCGKPVLPVASFSACSSLASSLLNFHPKSWCLLDICCLSQLCLLSISTNHKKVPVKLQVSHFDPIFFPPFYLFVSTTESPDHSCILLCSTRSDICINVTPRYNIVNLSSREAECI